MNKITVKDPEVRSADIVTENLDHLKTLFPEAFTEDKIDFEVLKQLLGGTVDEREEKYGLNWHGKRKARQLALTPSTGTLRPCPEESVNWHTTQNLMIEGDNLEVLKLLQKSYAGKVKLIYIDPPYNTGKDFIYPDDFRNDLRNYLEMTEQIDRENHHTLSSNSETSGRFHTNWLNMMYSRLKLARSLLTDNGVIIISIDDHEQSDLKHICNQVFGEENFVAIFCWQKFHSVKSNANFNVSTNHEYILAYSKNASLVKFNKLPMSEDALKVYKNPDNDHRGPWRTAPLTVSLLTGARGAAYKRTGQSTGLYEIQGPNGKVFKPTPGRCWISRESFEKLKSDNRIWWGKNNDAVPMQKIFLSERESTKTIGTFWGHVDFGSNKKANEELKELFAENAVETVNFPTPKPTQLIKKLIYITDNEENDQVIMDFFAGSGTTGDAVFRINAEDHGKRRFILVQLPERLIDDRFKTIAEITKERLRRAADKVKNENPTFTGDLGFRVFKLDSSNIRSWEPDRDDLEGSLLQNVEHIKSDRTENDILYELLLKLGLDLCVPIETRAIAGKPVHSVGAGTLITCLDEKIDENDVEVLAHGIVEWHQELAPAGDTTVVFRDSAFADDVAKTNLTAILDQRGLGNVRSL